MTTATIQQLLNTGLEHHHAGRFQQAQEAYRQILALSPENPEALHLLGLIDYANGQYESAEQLIRAAIVQRPTAVEFRLNLAGTLAAMNKNSQATAELARVLEARPDYPEALNLLGNVLRAEGKKDQAIDAYRRALAGGAKLALAHFNLGVVLEEAGRVDEAIASYSEAIKIQAHYPEAILNLAGALKSKGLEQEAIATYRAAIALRPDYAEAHNNLGVAYQEQGLLAEAEAAYRAAVGARPNYADGHLNLGDILEETGQLDRAIEEYREAVRVQPDYPEARVKLASGILNRGEFEEGWEQYEWRWKCREFPTREQNLGRPRWKGQPLEGKRILLFAEQAMGDTINLVRYAPLVAGRGGKVILECQPSLKRLLKSVKDVETVVTEGEELPSFDVYSPLFSLPWAFGSTLANLPAQVPYLWAEPAEIGRWSQKIAGDGLKVGLVWSGGKKPRDRSIAPELLAPLGNVKGARFFSLQIGEPAARTGIDLMDCAPQLHDFADTAALVSALDLLISIDTAAAHLAGALGRPVWTMLKFAADFRWLKDRQDSPWYPTMRLFRQTNRGDWDEVIQRVAAELSELTAKKAK